MSTPDSEMLLFALLTLLGQSRDVADVLGPPTDGTPREAPVLDPAQDVDADLEGTVERIVAVIAAIDELEGDGSPSSSA